MKVTDDTDLLVGEYVLGTLERNERARLEEIAEREPAVAAAVMVWERRLAPLHELIVSVEPPEHLWSEIEARLDDTEQDERERDPGFFDVYRELLRTYRADSAMVIVSRLRRWRSVAIVSIVVGLAIIAFLTAKLIEPHDVARSPLVSVLRSDAMAPPFIVVLDPEEGTLTVRSVPANNLPDRAYSFWLLRGDAEPLSLGRLRSTGVLRPDALRLLSRGDLEKAALAVSVEPNNAPLDRPTAPLVYRGGFE